MLGEVSLAEPSASERGLILVRAENIDVQDASEPGLVAARGVRFEYYGHDSVAQLEVANPEGGRAVPIVARIVGDRSLAIGRQAWLETNGPGRTLPVA